MSTKATTVSAQTLVSTAVPAAKLPQYVAALIATIGGFCLGTVLGWTSPVLTSLSDYYGFEVNVDSQAWIGSIMAIGAMVGCLPMSWMLDTFGRKSTIIILTVPTVAAWMMIIFAPSVTVICIARFILGFTTGAYAVAVPLYTSEISENEIRGTLGTYFQLQLTIGITSAYILGSLLPIFWMTMVCGCIPVVLALAMLIIPETPTYYLKKFRVDEARKALQWFRGSHYDVEPELMLLKANLDQMEAERVPFTQAFVTTPAKRGLVVGLGVMFFQQFSGVNAVIFYAESIFKAAGSSMSPSLQTIIVGLIMVVMTWVATLAIDRAGRRPLLLISASIMAICTAILGVYFLLLEKTPDFAKTIGSVPIVSLSIFIIVFSLGFGPIPWMFMSEIFPPQIKGPACSIACFFNWFSVFMVTKFFGDLQSKFGSYGTFWIFSGISIAGTFFVLNLVPETKGKSMEEIQKELGATPQMTPEDRMENGQKPAKF
ncbi:facilitated trehalose transporter Tret1-2 homolog [Nilaparvata lugens]|uniref:Sugar transporter 1 n=1 Tax=Nilaparvata lugens TaxID=108931 RepID=D4AHW6_NILLU|nr:facilitated trehalose transporter Tret1-2 homolog [Nilaparvata lugens]XP_039295825.1 facilitated trehalose transporter Tret1-2 homolog [Nilaparvata lugens]BAI83415.1 sugar transporter 1 [Nilaparvata lugens]